MVSFLQPATRSQRSRKRWRCYATKVGSNGPALAGGGSQEFRTALQLMNSRLPWANRKWSPNRKRVFTLNGKLVAGQNRSMCTITTLTPSWLGERDLQSGNAKLARHSGHLMRVSLDRALSHNSPEPRLSAS